jgi:CHAD domain-containing protein
VLTQRFAHEQANRLLTELSAQIARTAKSPDADAVHDLRVVARKFKCVLTALEPCFPEPAVKTIGRRVKQIMGLAGAVRDCDIALSLLEAGPLMEESRKAREDAAEAIVASLNGWVKQKSAAKWRTALKGKTEDTDFGSRPVGDTAKRMMPRMLKEHFEQGEEAARPKSGARELHKFRIATKKVRYTVDLFAPVIKEPVEGLVEEFKKLQSLLGEGNDFAVVRRMVPRGYADIRDGLRKKQRKKADEFRRMWPGKLRHWTKNVIS